MFEEEFEFEPVPYIYPASGYKTQIYKGVVKSDKSIWYWFDMQLIRRDDLPCSVKTLILHSSSFVIEQYNIYVFVFMKLSISIFIVSDVVMLLSHSRYSLSIL